MRNINQLIIDSIENTFETVVKNDFEYKNLEYEKVELINILKLKLGNHKFELVEKIIDCMGGQNFITAMSFCFVRVLELDKLTVSDECKANLVEFPRKLR